MKDHLLLAYKIHRNYNISFFFQKKFEIFLNLIFLSMKNTSTTIFKILNDKNP